MSLSVLIIDDEPVIRELLAFEFKKKRSCDVVEAEDGLKGLDALERNKVDLVISDVRMPECNGIEFVKKAQSQGVYKGPIYLLTGYTDIGIEEALDLGVAGMFAKPFKRTELVDEIMSSRKRVLSEWNEGQPDAVQVEASLDVSLTGFQSAIDGGALQVGRGGFFIEGSYMIVPPKFVSFHITLQDSPEPLRGIGRVHWNRRANNSSLRAGLGMEVLKWESGKDIFLRALRSKGESLHSFIPRGILASG